MLLDEVLKYYLEQNNNCAESVLKGANDYYHLGMGEDTFHALGGFGAGCCCGRMCGACAASVAVISRKYIATCAHEEPKACRRVAEVVKAFIEVLGSDNCKELKAMYWNREMRCQKTVEMASNLLQEKMDKFLAEDEAQAAGEGQ